MARGLGASMARGHARGNDVTHFYCLCSALLGIKSMLMGS